jgi:hypothetical protein
MSAQPVGVFGVGVSPPPDSSEPTSQARRSLADVLLVVDASVNMERSACVISPIFSGSDIRDIRSETRREIGRLASRYGNPWASMTTVGGSSVTFAAVSVVDRVVLIVLASDGVWLASVVTENVLLVPDGVPAGNVMLPEADV